MAETNFSAFIDQLGAAAAAALRNDNGAGDIWERAVATNNIRYYDTVGAEIDADGQIALGVHLRGRARNSVVVTIGGGDLDTKDSTIVGNNVEVRSRGRTRVIGRGAKVTTTRSRHRRTTSVQTKDVDRKHVVHSGAKTPLPPKKRRPPSS